MKLKPEHGNGLENNQLDGAVSHYLWICLIQQFGSINVEFDNKDN